MPPLLTVALILIGVWAPAARAQEATGGQVDAPPTEALVTPPLAAEEPPPPPDPGSGETTSPPTDQPPADPPAEPAPTAPPADDSPTPAQDALPTPGDVQPPQEQSSPHAEERPSATGSQHETDHQPAATVAPATPAAAPIATAPVDAFDVLATPEIPAAFSITPSGDVFIDTLASVSTGGTVLFPISLSGRSRGLLASVIRPELPKPHAATGDDALGAPGARFVPLSGVPGPTGRFFSLGGVGGGASTGFVLLSSGAEQAGLVQRRDWTTDLLTPAAMWRPLGYVPPIESPG